MANEYAKKFVKKLFAGCPNLRMAKEQRDDTVALYVEKLSKWHLQPQAWESALDRITESNDGNLPPLSVVYSFLKAAQAEHGVGVDPIALSFELNGLRYIYGRDTGRVDGFTKRRIFEVCPIEPSKLPALPDGASDRNLIIPPDKQVWEPPLTIRERRIAFATGWNSTGADPEECQRMFAAITHKPKEPSCQDRELTKAS